MLPHQKKWTKQKSDRREKNHDARVAPQSKVPWESLLTSEVSARAGNLKAERRTKTALIKRFREVILTQSREMEASEEVMKYLNEALEYSLENKAALGATLEAGLIELLKEESEKSGVVGDDVLTREETSQLVEHVSESMKSHIRMLDGKKHRFRFSPYLMGLSMNIYLQSVGQQRHHNSAIKYSCKAETCAKY